MSPNVKEQNGNSSRAGSDSRHVPREEKPAVNLKNAANGQGAMPHLPMGKVTPDKRDEDEEIFTFFKKYIALLTAAGSLPLITAGMDVIPPPDTAKKLSVVSSLTCVIVMGVCILFKSTFANLSVSRNIVARAIPPLLAVSFLAIGLAITGQYNPVSATEPFTGPWYENPNIVYLLIQPCFVAALGITLMASYSQFRGSQLAKSIDESFVGAEQISEMKSMIQSCARIFSASPSPTIEEFHKVRFRQISTSLATLSAGYVKSSGIQVEELQKTLFDCFKRSFHAVTDRDMKFWTNGSDDSSASARLTAKEYLRLNIDAVWSGVAVTRIFIFKDADFNNYEAGMVAVLTKHHEANIGWAVLLDGELPGRLKNAPWLLDFAVLDQGDAVAMFSKDDQCFYVCLQVPAQHNLIEEYRALYNELRLQCWLASTRFCEAHDLKDQAVTLDQAIAENQGKANALNFGSGKVVMIEQEADIGRAIEFIRGLRRKNMLYWDEVVSRNVIDLEGAWTYLLKGTDSRKKPFEHHGTCRAVIENRQAYFLGMRLQTTGEDGTLRKIIPPAPWQSSPIEFGDDGSMEFKSIISIDGTEVRGIARMQFVMPEKKRLVGGINYIVDPGQAVYAEVIFDRQAIEPAA